MAILTRDVILAEVAAGRDPGVDPSAFDVRHGTFEVVEALQQLRRELP